MRIVIVTQSYYPRPGGVTEHAFHTARELREKGHEVLIITSNFGDQVPREQSVIRLGRNILVPMNSAWVNLTFGLGLGEKLGRLLREFRPDIINTHCPLVPTLPLFALRKAPSYSSVAGTFHAAADSNYAYHILRPWLNRQTSLLDVRIAVSKSAKKLAEKYFAGEYHIIPNGIDCERFSPYSRPLADLRDGAINILFVGRLDKRKGVKYLFRAVSRLSDRLDRKTRLIVVGENSIRKLVLPKLNRKTEVVFTGIVPPEELPRYYASSDIFCAPAIGWESFGIVLLEAMASGTPIVATNIPGYLTLLKNRWNALVVEPKNEIALEKAIAELAENRDLRDRLVRNGLLFARKFSWKKITEKLERVFIEALSSKESRKEKPREQRTRAWV